ncbi:MAG TPA: ABC transporter substrate-binding protein [Thermoanaerobaculales bacterium]|nr:ABC transporter substrate-binding protein [Thermoanaerobaculales bacterium]HPA80673.1 ABC transporter substrate-binding protein [Thermoanaerobaculales bacterium]HQL29123.1 ABC transporter substrate-binding protein [Thermoanaerobaculales bacterium]HQN95045.1 ABC transporter substrate-binding protein [Thermoanaerobaculales bacterium]HQP43033.1 ABC transporter substrate-binding protein [Thermoanaerobaculales bacterium]
MNRLSLSAKVALAALATVAATGCGSKAAVGVLLPSTGAAASYGRSMKQGIDLAVKQGVADGTLSSSVRWVWGDSGTDPAKAVDALESLAKQGAHIVIAGTTSDEAKAFLPELERLNVVALSPSASAPDLTKASKNFFRVFASDELEGRRAGRFLREEQDDDTVAIYAEESEQARGIEPPFRQVFEQAMEGRVIGRISLADPAWQQKSADLLAANNPDAVYIIGYAEPALRVLRHLRERSYEGTICLTSAFYTADVVKREPRLLEGVFFPQPAFDMKDERDLVQKFVSSYQSAYGQPPDIYAAHAFDAARIVIHVIKQTPGFETAELRKSLMYSVKEFPGVTGPIQFDERGDVKHNPIMFTIRDGEVLNFERFVKDQKKLIRERIRDLLLRGN